MRVLSKNITKTRFIVDCMMKFLHGLVFKTEWGCRLSCNFNCHLSCNFNCRMSCKLICFNLSCWCCCMVRSGCRLENCLDCCTMTREDWKMRLQKLAPFRYDYPTSCFFLFFVRFCFVLCFVCSLVLHQGFSCPSNCYFSLL